MKIPIKCPAICQFERVELTEGLYVDFCNTCGNHGDTFGPDAKPIMNLIEGQPQYRLVMNYRMDRDRRTDG